MKKLLILMGVVFVAIAGWRINEFISRDAITMALGFLFGVMAGVPASLLMLAAQRRREESGYPPQRRMDDYPRQQPPIIVLNGQQPYAPQPPQPHHDQAPPWGATGGGNFHLLTAGQDQRYAMERPEDLKRKWREA